MNVEDQHKDAEKVLAAIDEMKDEEQKVYWDTQNKLSSVSAEILDYRASYRLLGYDPEDRSLYPPVTDRSVVEKDAKTLNVGTVIEAAVAVKKPRRLRPNPWQILGAVWAVRQEAGPVKGGITSDDCGTGKTIQ